MFKNDENKLHALTASERWVSGFHWWKLMANCFCGHFCDISYNRAVNECVFESSHTDVCLEVNN